VDKHESEEDKKTEVEESKLVSGSDVISNALGRERHVPPLRIID